MFNISCKNKVLLIICLFVSSCGGGGGSDNSEISNTTDNPLPVTNLTTQVNGTAVKGIVKNGTVSAYGAINGKKDITPLATGSTDDQGNYSLTIENYNGPLVIEISANSNTTMVCDIIEGCDDKIFSQELDLTDDFSLKAVVPISQSDKTITANISAITTLATVYAESHDDLNTDVVSDVNSQVATLFNITGKITEIDIIDITDLESMKTAVGETKEIAILNSALLSATLKNKTNNITTSEALKLLADEFASQEGQIINHETIDSEKVALSDVYDKAIEMINHSYFEDINFETLRPTLQMTLASAEEKVGLFTNATPKEPADKNIVQAAKNMVETVRKFGLESTYKNADELSIAEQIELATSLSSHQELNALSAAIETASRIFGTANDANMDALESNDLPLNSYSFDHVGNTVLVNIAEINNGYQYSIINTPIVVQAPNSIPITLDLIAEISMDKTEGSTITSEYLDLSLKISGTLSSTFHEATITDGDINISIYENNSEFSDTDPFNFGLEDFDQDEATDNTCFLDIAINLIINQTNTINPVTFSGLLSLDPTRVGFCSGNNNLAVTESDDDLKSLILSGQFEQNSNSVKAIFHASLEAETWDEISNSGSLSDVYINTSNIDTFDEIVIYQDNIGIDLEFEKSATSDITGLSISTAFDENSNVMFSMDIALGSSSLDFDLTNLEDNPQLTVTDHNGSKLQITTDCEILDSCEPTGSIKVNNKIAATISYDGEKELYIIEYKDDSFEVL
jgi:hypothetical protein